MKKNQNLLVIDCQVLQTSSFYRGMGRYSLFLLKSLFQNGIDRMYSKIVLLFEENLSIEQIQNDLVPFLSKNTLLDKIHYPNKVASKKNILENQLVLDKFIKKKYHSYPIDFLILSAFELDQTLSVFPSDSFKILLFYDLIPLLFEKEYLTNQNTVEDYFSRFKQIFDSDLILSISDATKNDLISYLNIDKFKIVNIGGGLINKKVSPKKPKIQIKKPYFLFPSGDNWRKNNEKTIEAFRFFNKQKNFSLVITSDFNEMIQKVLRKDDPNIIFSNRITDGEMLWLYQNSEGVVFPSIYEGFGLPVLEAVEQKKLILLSNIDAFKEFGQNAFIWCDPNSTKSIASGFSKLINGKVDLEAYKEIPKHFNWQQTSKSTLKGIEDYKINNQKTVIAKRKKVALVGPTPNGYSAIGKFCQDLLPTMQQIADVDFYYEIAPNRPNFKKSYFNYVWNCFSISRLPANYKKYDQIIYNIGNSEFHVQTYFSALIHPDTIILHDIDLSGLYSVIENNFLKWQIRKKKEKELESLFVPHAPAQYIISLINRQKKIICHNNYALQKIKKLNFLRNPYFLSIAHPFANMNVKKNIKNEKKLTIAISGLISYEKGLNHDIEIIKNYCSQYNFIVFGYTWHDKAFLELTSLAKKNQLELYVNVSDYEFNQLLKRSDFLINLRPNYRGEASRSVLDGLKNGTIPIVSNIGWFAELPNNLAIKLEHKSELSKLLLNEHYLNEYKNNYNFAQVSKYLESISYKKYLEKVLS